MAERESQIVLGLDPDPAALWPGRGASRARGRRRSGPPARRCSAHCRALIDATAEACVAVKLQLARFEVLGAPGRSVLGAVAAHARAAGLLVIADGKRGDIDVTAAAYAACAVRRHRDARSARRRGSAPTSSTVNPLMGRDAIEPFVAAARAAGAGVLVLVRTSNPGAADIEDLRAARAAARCGSGSPRLVDELGAARASARRASATSGAVVGATAPGPPRARARADAARAVPAARRRRAGGARRGPRAGVRARPGRRARHAPRAASPAPTSTRGGEPAAAARAEAERLREPPGSCRERC